jgi:hypothetical protein
VEEWKKNMKFVWALRKFEVRGKGGRKKDCNEGLFAREREVQSSYVLGRLYRVLTRDYEWDEVNKTVVISRILMNSKGCTGSK